MCETKIWLDVAEFLYVFASTVHFEFLGKLWVILVKVWFGLAKVHLSRVIQSLRTVLFVDP